MAGSITGTQTNTFAKHSRSEVSVVWKRDAGSDQVLDFTNEDDAIQLERTNDTVSLTEGLYGNTTANINTSTVGVLTLKIKMTGRDNGIFGDWERQTKAGDIDPAIFVISGGGFKHIAKDVLPTKPGTATPASSEDPSVEWTFQCADTDMWVKI